jgi:hypothetical protein
MLSPVAVVREDGKLWSENENVYESLHRDTSSSSALQLFMSFDLLNYFFPLFPLLRPLFPVLHSQLSQVISRVVFPS